MMEFAVKLRDYEWSLIRQLLMGEPIAETDEYLAQALAAYLGAQQRMEEARAQLQEQIHRGPKREVVVFSSDQRHWDNDLTKNHLRRED